MRRNLTVQLDESTIDYARDLAYRRCTSISGLVTSEIERLVADDIAYQRARATALAHLDAGFNLDTLATPADRTDRTDRPAPPAPPPVATPTAERRAS